jgi:hypothetical protein
MSEPNAVVDELAQLEAEIEAARKAREEFEAAQAKAKRTQELKDELEAEKRALKDAQTIADLEAKHGPIGKALYKVDTSDGMIVLKKPNHLLFKKHQDVGKNDSAAMYKLVRPCLAHPDVTAFESILESEPATLVRCSDAVCYLAGIRRSDWEGK